MPVTAVPVLSLYTAHELQPSSCSCSLLILPNKTQSLDHDVIQRKICQPTGDFDFSQQLEAIVRAVLSSFLYECVSCISQLNNANANLFIENWKQNAQKVDGDNARCIKA